MNGELLLLAGLTALMWGGIIGSHIVQSKMQAISAETRAALAQEKRMLASMRRIAELHARGCNLIKLGAFDAALETFKQAVREHDSTLSLDFDKVEGA